MIASEEKPDRQKKSCGCCVPCLCACCTLQTILCAILLVTLLILANFILVDHWNNQPKKLSNIYRYPRLAKEIKPIHYEIFLLPNLQNGTFEGKVNITLKTEKENQEIVLHSKNLTIQNAQLLEDTNRTVIKVNSVKTLLDVVVLNLTQKIVPGLYHLTIIYKGNMKNKLTGFYQSHYKDENNETR